MDGTCVNRSPPYASKPAMMMMITMIVFDLDGETNNV